MLVIYYAVYNLLKFRSILSTIKCTTGRKLYLILFGKPVKVRDFLKMRFTYLLTIPRKSEFACRASFSIEEEEESTRKLILKYVNEGILSLDDYIWITPALPHVFFILVGYILSLLTPEQLLMHILSVV